MAIIPSNFQITPFTGALLENTELSFSSLFLHHIYSGPKPNQSNIIAKDAITGLGSTAVNNWPIYDGVGPGAKLVARAQGLHTYAGNWHNSFTIVFEVERFRGCTLQVMGVNVSEDGEWAIVGGTGEFAMATGVINRKVYQRRVDGKHGNIMELTIHAFCRSPAKPTEQSPSSPTEPSPPTPAEQQSPPTPTKFGPWGGDGGSVRDITETPRRLESITIGIFNFVKSIAFSYVDQAGQSHSEGPWGDSDDMDDSETIQLGPSEFVKEVSGTIQKVGMLTIIGSLKFVTNQKTYGPFGPHTVGSPFSAPVPENKSVVGFYGRSGIYLDAIGVYTS